MKKNVLLKSKRMAAFALSLSLVFGEGSFVGAAELEAPQVPSTVEAVEEAEETTEADTEAAVEAEAEAAAETVEAGTKTTEETAEADTETSAKDDAGASSREDVEQIVPEETAPEEETETTETAETAAGEEADGADLEEETEEKGAYDGTPSKVIGLKGWDSESYDNGHGEIKKANGELMEYNAVYKDVPVYKAGKVLSKYRDTATGLYKVDDTYYASGEYIVDDDTTKFSTEVVRISVDRKPYPATGLYVDDDGLRFYSDAHQNYAVDGTLKSQYVLKSDEVVPISGLDAVVGTDIDGIVGDDYYYYPVNGKYYAYLGTTKYGTYYVSKEITFDKIRPYISWNELTTENVKVNAQGKKLHIGYQLKINNKVDDSRSYPVVSSKEGSLALYTSTGTALDNTLLASRKTVKIQVRGVYYVENEKKDSAGNKVVSYVAESIGEWSDVYTFTAKEKTPATPPKLSGKLGSDGKITFSWTPIKAADSNYLSLYEVMSKVPLNNITSDNFEAYYELARRNDDSEGSLSAQQKALLGTLKLTDLYYGSYNSVAPGDSLEVDSAYTYHYYALRVNNVIDGYKASGTYSNIKSTAVPNTKNTPKVKGFKAEKQSDGSYKLSWNPMEANVVIFAYEKKKLPTYFSEGFFYNMNGYGTWGEVATSSGYSSQKFLYEQMDSIKKKLVREVKYVSCDGADGSVNISDFGLETGVTYYFTAYTYDNVNIGIKRTAKIKTKNVEYTHYTDISSASNTVSVKNALNIPQVSTKVSNDSIKLTLSNGGGTGYEIYRLSGKKYQKIATTTNDVYTDSGLEENTKYSYKVRAYNYNKNTKKTTYSGYKKVSVSTSLVTDIVVKVTAKSKSSAKVAWTKVKGAEKYEIYRTNTANSDPKMISKKYENVGNVAQALTTNKYELVKTVAALKTTSYTDRKLEAGETYTYVVVAYYSDGETTGYIMDDDEVTLAVQKPQNVQTTNKGTSAKVTWDKDIFASRYEVKYKLYDKYGNATSKIWKVRKTKKASYTVKGLQQGGYAEICVRAYGKNKTYSEWTYAYYTNSLKTAGKITARNITEQQPKGKKRNVVKISWKKVSGAKYYKVYRSTKTAVYNKDEKKYINQGELIAKEGNNDETNDTVYYSEYSGEPGSIKGTSAIDRAWLEDGVTYYYTVVAFGEKGSKIASYVTADNKQSTSLYATSEPASVVYNSEIKIASLENPKAGKVVVNYNKVTSASQYVIYRSEKKNGTYTQIGTSKKKSYTDKTAEKGKTYYYKVVATGTNGLKADMEIASSVKKITVKK